MRATVVFVVVLAVLCLADAQRGGGGRKGGKGGPGRKLLRQLR